MGEKPDHWEYIGTYIDDLAITSKDPQAIVDKLVKEYKFKLKGTGPISYHLGCDFVHDEDKVLCIQPRKYIEQMVETYVRLFGEKPKEIYSSPLEKGDHPELDTSDLLGANGIQKFQPMIGAMQWAISLGRFDIATAIMSLSSFRVAPHVGHLKRCKCIYTYLSKMRHAVIRVQTEEPDFSALLDITYNWAQSVYGNVKEVIPEDCPKPLGKHVTLSHCVDANSYHDMLSGHSVTRILHFVNKCPIDWYSKKQGMVETATFGSEANAARTATEQTIETPATCSETTRLLLTVVCCPKPSFTRGIQCSPTIAFMKPLQVEWSSSFITLVRLTQLTFLVSIGDTSNSSRSCSGREIHESCSKRSIARKPMVSLNGETPPTKVVAIEPILGPVKYEAGSHYHSVFRGDHIHSRVLQCSVESPFISVREIMMVTSSSSRKWGVTRFQQV